MNSWVCFFNDRPSDSQARRPCGEVSRAVSFDNADRLPVVVRFPAGPQVSLKVGDQPKGRWRRPKKKRPSDSQADVQEDDAVSDAYSAGTVAQDPVFEETPVDVAEGEALDEDRIVQYTDDFETVVVDGVSMTLNCTLKTLRAGCASLGLSGRGSKVKCIKRMVEHVKAQSLLAAHGAEVKTQE